MEREARTRERMLKEQQRRQSAQGPSSSGGNGDRKRSFAEAEEKPFAPPTGPSAERNRKRHRGSYGVDGGGEEDAGAGASSGRKGRESRRVSYKYEDEENDEARARRVESEREAARWG